MNLENEGIIYCPFCGKSITPNSVFCENCGKDLLNGLMNYNQIVQEIKNYNHYSRKPSFFIRGRKRKKIEVENELKIINIKIKFNIFLKSMSVRIKQIEKNIIVQDTYLIYLNKTSIIKEIQDYNNSCSILSKSKITNIVKDAEVLRQYSGKALFFIDNFNNNFINDQKNKYADLFKNGLIELDDDQKRAVITDDKYNLVIAGAGSGKTEVLITRAAYLAKREADRVKSERILAIAFQRKAKEEIKERLKNRYQMDIQTETFHSLGRKILNDYADEKRLKRPILKDEVNEERKRVEHIKNLFNTEIENKEFRNDVINFMKVYGDNEVIENENNLTEAELFDYQRNLRYTALNGRKVKSESERQIMNYFLSHKLNGENIDIVYEAPAEWMEYTNEETGQRIQPRPDFFFPDFGIYLEHWALNAEGKVPDWFGGKNPTETYKKNREIKRKKFIENNKILIETSEADFGNGPIEPILKERFLNALRIIDPAINYEIEAMPYEELVKKVWHECKEFVDFLPTNISRFITIAKTYNLSPSDIEIKLKIKKWSPKQLYFGKIAIKIFEKYKASLGGDIDFEDMINDAIVRLRENENFYHNLYDHILIDEYQDISAQRYELINQLMKKNPNSKLFCVGDDWQSIMGFAGSNLNFFNKFEDYFNNPAKTYLTKNYRSTKSIVNTGEAIIRNNKTYIKKNTISNSNVVKPIIVYSITHTKNYRYKYYKQMALHCLNKIKEIKENENIHYSDFMILFRTRIPLYFKMKKIANLSDINIPLDESEIGDYVRLMTVHKSKGLQSKYVFILNVDKDTYGFPSEVENPKIFEPAIENNDEMREEEERRLLYVALTRAKEGVFVYSQKCVESCFIKELELIDYVKKEELDYKEKY